MIAIAIIFRRLSLLAATIVVANGCATQASLTVLSQPEGAFITERGTGKSYGTTPVVLYYDGIELLKYKDSGGCYLVKGLDARWVSGASASLESIRLCGSNLGDYNISFNRDPTQPDLERDLEFALKVQALRTQQQQAKAAQDAAAATLFSAWATTQRTSVKCTSTQFGDVIRTNCK
jgi:hypothetical protein